MNYQKNKYEIAQNYLLNLENEELRERLKKLTIELNDLKKKYGQIQEGQQTDRMVQNVRDNEIVEKPQNDSTD